jgi:large subunit ribosomal protein L13
MKTYQAKSKDINRKWHLIDADGKVLGRISTEIARLLIGKHKKEYSPYLDMGDYVVVTNVEKVILTGKKELQKVYRKHSGYPGGFKEIAFSKIKSQNPKKIFEMAVGGMLPDNRLKKNRINRLKLVIGGNNPFESKFK